MNKGSISIKKFDAQRATEFPVQARIALAGYDACHELGACMLSAALDDKHDARILVVGAGGSGGEIDAESVSQPVADAWRRRFRRHGPIGKDS